jgi:hypothetical protein
MADPQIDEGYLLASLSIPCASTTIDQLQAGAAMAVLDGFDRKIMREPFARLLTSAISFNVYLSQLQVISRLIDLEKAQKLTAERLAEAKVQLIGFGEIERLGLLKQVQLVASCPTSEDKVS